MVRFWVYVGDKIQGPVDIPSLRKVTGFNLLTQVCLEGEENWRMADEVIEIKSYFLSPPKANSFAIDAGNTALHLESITPRPDVEELTLPEPNTSWTKPDLEVISSDGQRKEPGGPAALRMLCDVCGYKNPRDVPACMKCGEALKGPTPVSSSPAASSRGSMDSPPATAGNDGKGALAGMTKAVTPAAAPIATPVSAAPTPTPARIAADPATSTMVEISMSKLLLGGAAACLVVGCSFFGYRSWKKHHRPKPAPFLLAPKVVPGTTLTKKLVPGTTLRPGRRNAKYNSPALPGLAQKASRPADPAPAPVPKVEEATYRVVAEATPLKKRFSSPINSPYAVKRRANQGLWSAQEDHAIQQVQRNRIYGGQRTVNRNVEILMQILRDREYNTAFESGKRIYLYNDLDWSAVLKDGPVYEVRLTFSGGREADGSPKKPLHFAFLADLERGTVEPGGEDQIRSNTLHAFFDESRIAPEDRRAIAKDTEELVLASQPGASPLAMDTVVRQFAKVYTTAALSRVADAYDLALAKKKLAHDTRLGSEDPITPVTKGAEPKTAAKGDQPPPSQSTFGNMVVQPAQQNEKGSDSTVAAAGTQTPVHSPFRSGAATDFRMERGAGRERTFLVRTVSKASVNKIWEILTGYDRLKQFMPDMISSEREGQDGAAVIVHAVCLTRFMFFVFKINLHVRVIEHPAQHTLEFERIAGDLDSLRGSVEIITDPATRQSQINFRATVVPTGSTLNTKLETMARRLLVPQMDTLRAKAESN